MPGADVEFPYSLKYDMNHLSPQTGFRLGISPHELSTPSLEVTVCASLPVLYNAEDTFKTSPKLEFSTDCTTSPALRESSAFLLGRSVTAFMDLLSPSL